MDAITYSAARQNLAQTMNAVCENHAPVIITRQKSEPVVLMSLERGEVVSCSLDEL